MKGRGDAHLRRYTKTYHDAFSWPTDGCGYDQHARFVHHRNANWHGGSMAEWRRFVLAYAAELESTGGEKL